MANCLKLASSSACSYAWKSSSRSCLSAFAGMPMSTSPASPNALTHCWPVWSATVALMMYRHSQWGTVSPSWRAQCHWPVVSSKRSFFWHMRSPFFSGHAG